MKIFLPLVTTPPDWAVLFGPVADGVTSTVTALLPVAIPILVLLAGITIALRTLGKFGVRK